MERAGRLGRQQIHALKALVSLAREPANWSSVTALATDQDLPAALLEQLLLRLRRAGLVEARRGRLGGYRLALQAEDITLTMVLRALREPRPIASGQTTPPSTADRIGAVPSASGALPAGKPEEQLAAERVTEALERRLQKALERELDRITIEDLLFDLRSSQAGLEDGGGLMLP